MRNPIAPLLGLCALVCAAHAAPVTWTTGPTPTVDENSISTTGTLVNAGHWGSDPVSVTVGSEIIRFDRPPHGRYIEKNFSVCSGGDDYSNGDLFTPPGAIDPGFEAVMDGFAYGGKVVSVTFQGLIPGATYQVQLFASDDRTNCCHSRSQKWSDNGTSGAGNETAAYVMDTSPYVIGQFVADASHTQTVYAIGIPTPDETEGNVDGINAYVLRVTNLPNPTGDTDGDGLSDIDEIVNYQTNPVSADTDGDNVPDGQEVSLGTDPLTRDFDSDGFMDGLELAYGTDPLDSASIPAALTTITWGVPQNITGNLSDFATNGAKVLAWTGGSNPVTINGITDGGGPLTFVSGWLLDDRYTGFDPFNRGHDADYETLLDSGSYAGGTRLITLPGLIVGHQYQLQVWYSDTRDCCAGRPGSYGTDPTTPAVNLLSGSKEHDTPVVPAQYVIGTFTAQHTIEAFYSGYTVGAQYNALMLRDVTAATGTDLVITSSKFESGAFKVTVTGLTATKNYKLVRSTDLVTFTDVSGGAFTATSATQIVSDTAPPANKAFYRVVLVP